MWTPKRIVTLVLGFFIFFSGFLLYASCLGGIDGLPPLPDADLPLVGPRKELATATHVLHLDQKLILAFGPDCRELHWALKLELNARGMVVAARDFSIEPDGRLKLDMVSLALFGKEPTDGRDVEINTVRGKLAYLTFDKPLGRNERDFGGRRIVAAELIGDDADNIEIVNNHHTLRRDDDLHVLMVKGPLYYDETKNLIWTDDNVKVEDDQNEPHTEVRGRGMEVRLAAAEPPPARPDGKPARGKPKSAAFSGVESIALKADVDMNLYAAGGFLAPPPAGAKAAPPAAAKASPPPAAKPGQPDKAEKDHINIYTLGRFEYQFHKDGDIAVFDAGGPDAGQPRKGQWDVRVTREGAAPAGKAPMNDQLLCQHLELRLSHRESVPGARGAAPADQALTIEGAHAVTVEGGEVVITSDAQKLEAHGDDLTYDARTKLTVLQGDPKKDDSGMWANQDGNLIHARDIRIQEQQGPDGSAWRQVTARGPGRLDLKPRPEEGGGPTPAAKDAPKHPGPPDKAAGQKANERPLHATWQDLLTSTKDGAEDLLTLQGAATFTDDEHGQTMRAETLKLWTAAPQAGPKTVPGPSDKEPARRPSRLEATGNVSVQSPQLNIPQAGRLVVLFRDVPAGATLPAAPAAAKDGPPATAKNPPAADAAPGPGKAAGPATAAAPSPMTAGTAPPAKSDPEPERPIELQARSVYAWVARSEEKSALETLQADGFVRVHQDPAKGDERGTDIVGESLTVNYQPEGYALTVSCDETEPNQDDLAQLFMNQIYIVGQNIHVDQAANTVEVTNGPGAMQMQSKTNFQGEALAKPVPMTIHWNKNMFFNGRFAEFTDHVQGEQENAHLACQSLQVFFDQPISLKEGNHGGPPPRVKNLVCHQDVRVEDNALVDGKLVRYQSVFAPSLEMNPIEPDGPGPAPGAAPAAAPASEGNEIRAPGPGELRILQHGGQDPLAPPDAGPGAKAAPAKPGAEGKAPDKPAGGKPAAKPDGVTKLTYVRYGDEADAGSMYLNSKTKVATFLGNPRVLNMPCEDPHLNIDLDVIRSHLPEGALYLQSQRLRVVDNGDKQKSQQEMTAEGSVRVQAKDFWGRSDKMFYNEAKDQIIFVGGENGLATLYRVRQRGAEPQKIEGKTITYIRSTGKFKIEGGEWISGN